MTLREILNGTSNWLRGHRFEHGGHCEPMLDDDGLLTMPQDPDDEFPGHEPAASERAVMVNTVTPLERREPIERLQEGFHQLIDQLAFTECPHNNFTVGQRFGRKQFGFYAGYAVYVVLEVANGTNYTFPIGLVVPNGSDHMVCAHDWKVDIACCTFRNNLHRQCRGLLGIGRLIQHDSSEENSSKQYRFHFQIHDFSLPPNFVQSVCIRRSRHRPSHPFFGLRS